MGLDVFIVRTRLQALIVEKILKNRKKFYISVFLYQNNIKEDSEEVYKSYESLKEKSIFSINVVSANGFFGNFLKFLILKILIFFSKGQCYLACIDSYSYALAEKCFPFVKLNTFDDGAANILTYSKYYNECPLPIGGLKRKLLRKIFPEGCAKYLRGRISKHYTIFPRYDNIVEKEKIRILDWLWDDFLDIRDSKYINKDVSVVILGTTVHESPNSENVIKIILDTLPISDIYIRHPRELKWLNDPKSINLYSPAEAYLSYIARDRKINVYHFNSTVAYSLCTHKNISFIDLTG